MAKKNKRERKVLKATGQAKRVRGGIVQALLAVLVVAVGVALAVVLMKLRKPPAKSEQPVADPLVEVEQLHVRDIQMIIGGYGTVQPKVEVDIVPEVGGKVVSLHPELRVGGFIAAGEQILQIDPRDYELAVQQAKAAVADAQVRLDIEQAEAEVSRREWQDLHPAEEPASPLVLREPQIQQAKAAVESARAQLATADLRLERTTLSLPFDSLIASEKVDVGQYVAPGQSLGVAYGVEVFEVEVPLEDKELAWFDVFGAGGLGGRDAGTPTVSAEIRANFAGAERTWQGYVSRTTGQVDRMSRMVPVVVEVRNPLEPGASQGTVPLLPGTFVEVAIQGKLLADAVAVPRDAIRQGNEIWLVNGGRLHIRSPQIVRTDKDFAYVVSGIEDKALIVLSGLDVPIAGMKIRTQPELPKVKQVNDVGTQEE
ncbi:MAG: efflux RND transporter periplasmic adaptor subunit [Phycisphaerales bacterium]|nr:MAG: efflux RND transporter periplasmic adaptor subunit [Phycisphaerales bacterium]